MPDIKPEIIELRIGDIKCSNQPAVFNCLGLGSCVGLFVYDCNNSVAGGAHVMLPESNSYPKPESCYYADVAMKVLMGKLKKSCSSNRFYAKITGGASVLRSDTYSIGYRNGLAIKQLLKNHKITLVKEDLGGRYSRSVHFYFPSNILEVRTSEGNNYQL